MITNSKTRRGSALALVVLFGLVLSVLATAVYMLFKSNAASYRWNYNKLQARYTAEAGANLSVHMIMGGSDVPQGDDAIRFLPDSGAAATWYDMPGEMGEVMVYVDPSHHNPDVSTSNAYQIRALAKRSIPSGEGTYGMITAVVPENFARFACFLDEPNLGGYYADGYHFDGPFYANGPIWIYSVSSTSDNDPWFYSLQLTSSYYCAQSSQAHATSPVYGNLTIQPADRMALGAPYFELNADTIPFGKNEVNWQAARDAAQSGGLYLTTSEAPDGTRFIISRDTVMWRRFDGGPIYKCWLDTLSNPVVWIENDPTDAVYLKSIPDAATSGGATQYGLDTLLTFGTRGTIYGYGPLVYKSQNMDPEVNRAMLGLISVDGDFLMADDPEDNGMGDWGGDFEIEMPYRSGGADWGNIPYHCVMMVLEGEWAAEKYYEPYPQVDFNILGGYIVNDEGLTGTSGGDGFNSVIYYDVRLMSMHPPYFPQTGTWHVIYWEERPGLNESIIGQNLY
ncbi:hypothetical protein GF402_02480 [Candidatus Fermentibacteria bacterium]|nr:hypothetical protein [Candidatus Fermentibacteria bacterium]